MIENQTLPPDLGISFNGSLPNFEAQPTDELICPTGIYPHHIEEHTAFNFHFEANRIKEGWNEIVVHNGAPAAQQEFLVCVVSVELAVRKTVRISAGASPMRFRTRPNKVRWQYNSGTAPAD